MQLSPWDKALYLFARAPGIRRRVAALCRRLRSPAPASLPVDGTPGGSTTIEPYTPRTYAGSMTLFCGRVAACGELDTRLDWRQFVAGGFDLQWVPGNHHAMMREPVITRQVAGALRERLLRAKRAGSGSG